MVRVVVVGGSGFLGSHVADELSRRGYAVTIYDKEPPPWLTSEQQFVQGDLLDQPSLAQCCKQARYVYHFAGVADIGVAKVQPYQTIESNVLGVASVLEAVGDSGAERFVYASTMYVYSAAGSFYRASKQAAEAIIEAYCDSLGLDFTFLRYGSLYGPRAQDWNGLRGYVHQVIEDGCLHYPGSGNEQREYIHVRDAARLSVDVLDPKHRNEAITVTGSQIMSSTDLAEMIFEIVGKSPKITFSGENNQEHYRITPYRYSPRSAKKLVPSEFVDLGQGILELCEELSTDSEVE